MNDMKNRWCEKFFRPLFVAEALQNAFSQDAKVAQNILGNLLICSLLHLFYYPIGKLIDREFHGRSGHSLW
jgi:hypothetical protein